MPRKKSRVVIDTNIWVSFLIGKVLSGLEDLIIDNRIQLLLSDELLEEMNDVHIDQNFKDTSLWM